MSGRDFNYRIYMLLFGMILWLLGFYKYGGNFTFFLIIGSIIYTGLLIINLYMTYYYNADKQTGIKSILVLVCWSVNFALINPVLAIAFIGSSYILYRFNKKYVSTNLIIAKLEYPITFYFNNLHTIPSLIITFFTILFWVILYFFN